ncbi:polyprenyl diphosphate synthase [Alphaproteobacteria bacterium]|nr:polyprenyl diphosphate synthase [Alphaproteobacteria bacterium]
MLDNDLEHIAFILDGNKRWAKKNNINLKKAYQHGLENISNLIDDCLNIKIKYLTLFTLSSENIKRSSVNNIFQVIYDDFTLFFNKIINEKKVKIKIIGSKINLPNKILNLINHCENETKENKNLILNLAFNYGFKDEIKEVLNKIKNNSSINTNNNEEIRKLFFISDIPDPDLLIRTGGRKRLSNFIMYNLVYSEIFFIDTLWPDFNFQELKGIINDYKKINRTYGL